MVLCRAVKCEQRTALGCHQESPTCKGPRANNESPPALETELDKHPDSQERSHDPGRSKIIQLRMWNKEKKRKQKLGREGWGEKTEKEMLNFQGKIAK